MTVNRLLKVMIIGIVLYVLYLLFENKLKLFIMSQLSQITNNILNNLLDSSLKF